MLCNNGGRNQIDDFVYRFGSANKPIKSSAIGGA